MQSSSKIPTVSLKDAEKELNKMKQIKFAGHKSFKSIAQVLKHLFEEKTITNPHVWWASYKTYNQTYYLTDKIQCSGGKGRSIVDIYRLCKFYIPSCTLKRVIKEIKRKCKHEWYCPSVGQTMFKIERLDIAYLNINKALLLK